MNSIDLKSFGENDLRELSDRIEAELKRRDMGATLGAVRHYETMFFTAQVFARWFNLTMDQGYAISGMKFSISQDRTLSLEMRRNSENRCFVQLVVEFPDGDNSILRDYFNPMDASASGIQAVTNNLLLNFVFSEMGENGDYHRFPPGRVEEVKARYPVSASGFILPSEYLVKHQQ